MYRTHCHAACAALLFAIAGCAPTTPNLDRHFGEGLNLAKAQQTLNPQAGRNLDPVSGIDNKAASGIVSQYAAGYARPAVTAAPMTSGQAQ